MLFNSQNTRSVRTLVILLRIPVHRRINKEGFERKNEIL